VYLDVLRIQPIVKGDVDEDPSLCGRLSPCFYLQELPVQKVTFVGFPDTEDGGSSIFRHFFATLLVDATYVY